MNSSTVCKHQATTATRRQSIPTLAFFCFVILTALTTSCSENIFQTPFGNKTLVVDTLNYDHTVITSVKNLNVSASGNTLTQNKAGNYRDMDAKFMIKFTGFTTLTGLPDSVYAVINEANVVLYKAGYWGNSNQIDLDMSIIDTDTTYAWWNNYDAEETFAEIESHTQYYGSFTYPVNDDSIYVPLDVDMVNDWYSYSDSTYANNGFVVTGSNALDGIIAFYSFDASDQDPHMLLECSLYDTNDVYIMDSTFTVNCTADLQYTESSASVSDSLFYLSQGNIFRSFIQLDDLREDSLLGPTYLMNRAQLKLFANPLEQTIDTGDTLYLTARLFKTDYWEGDSIQYSYTTQSSVFTENADTITIDISQLLQYMVSNPKEMTYEGVFFYLNNEYYDFNMITLDPSKTELDIVYTKVKDE